MADKRYRTLSARPSADTLVKPGELIDVVEVTLLTLADRRIGNLLLANARDAIERPVTHVIAKGLLRGNCNSNDRIGPSIERLMSAIVRIGVIWNGEPAVERVQLPGGNVEMLRRDGPLEFGIPKWLRKIIPNSTIFARPQREVMFALTSKQALALYEMVRKRGNLRWKSSEKVSLDEIRGILGVPMGKLTSRSNLKLRAIDPAVTEVNALPDFVAGIVAIRTGRRITHVGLRWWRKDGQGAAGRGLEFSSIGRKGRVADKVERPVPAPPPCPIRLEARLAALRSQTYETARMGHPGYDIYHVEGEWRDRTRGKGVAADFDRAYLAFLRTFLDINPL